MSGKDSFSKIINMFGIKKLLLVLVAGAVLVILSIRDIPGYSDGIGSSESDISMNTEEACTSDIDDYTAKLEKQVESVLTKVSGVGSTKVMVTIESTAEKIVLKDTPYETESVSETDTSGVVHNKENHKSEEKTIYISEEGNNIPYIVKEIEPIVKGVVVVAKGGDDAKVKKEIIEAIQVLFGIEAHKIKVMKLE